jgi:hypothetical protein
MGLSWRNGAGSNLKRGMRLMHLQRAMRNYAEFK